MNYLKELEDIFSLHFDFDIKEKSRKKKYIEARYIFSYISKNHLKFNYSQISKHLEFKEHSTIINYIKKFKYILMGNEKLKDKYNKVLQDVNEKHPFFNDRSIKSKQTLLDYHKKRVLELTIEIKQFNKVLL